MDARQSADRIDMTKAHPARRYDYWLGGKNHFPADRESGDFVASVFPTIRVAVTENRRFLRRAVTYLVEEAGIRQFLDIGSGLPSTGNVHEVAQGIAPEARVVYVDNDPIVLAHSRALLRGTPEGRLAYIEADVREPESILAHPDLLDTLDLSQPVALMLVAVLHFLPDDDDPYGIVRRLIEALPPGSHVVLSHAISDHMSAEQVGATKLERENERSAAPFLLRSTAEFARFFDGLDMVPPGVTSIVEWRPELPVGRPPTAEEVSMAGAIGKVG